MTYPLDDADLALIEVELCTEGYERPGSLWTDRTIAALVQEVRRLRDENIAHEVEIAALRDEVSGLEFVIEDQRGRL